MRKKANLVDVKRQKARVPPPAYVGVETVWFVEVSVGGYRDLLGQSGLALSVAVVNHPEAVVAAVAGKRKEVRSSNSEGRIVEENVLERVGVCETSEVEAGEEVFARLPVLLLLHVVPV